MAGWRPIFRALAECAGLTTRILHNSLLQSVTAVWNFSKKKVKTEEDRDQGVKLQQKKKNKKKTIIPAEVCCCYFFIFIFFASIYLQGWPDS